MFRRAAAGKRWLIVVLAAAPAEHSGVASAANNDVARFGGLLAVAALPALAGITGTAHLHSHALAASFRTAALILSVTCVAGGVLAAFTTTNPGKRPTWAAEPIAAWTRRR